VRVLLVAAAVILAARGCFGHPWPPTICGKVIGGANQPFMIDATSGDRSESGAAVAEFWVRLTDSCDEGVAIQVQPPDAATISKQVMATDGKPVAIHLRADQHDFVLLLHRHNGTRNTVRFRISSDRLGGVIHEDMRQAAWYSIRFFEQHRR
jgi:hypothetical protein